MNGFEFEKRVKKLARRQSLPCYFANHGKGSHGRLYVGSRFATLKDRRKEISKGLLTALCKQLDIHMNDL